MGYRTKVEMSPGVFDGEAYDTRQAADLGNHLVLTATPRAERSQSFAWIARRLSLTQRRGRPRQTKEGADGDL